jgi:hypothetical protein
MARSMARQCCLTSGICRSGVHGGVRLFDPDRNGSEPASELALEVVGLRDTCWRQAQRISSLEDTIRVLRTGANALAIQNADLDAEVVRLRTRS